MIKNYLNKKEKFNKIIIPPKGPFYLNGFSKSYFKKFNKKYSNIIEEDFYYDLLEEINDIISNYWPCNFFLFFIGYFLGILTFGLTCFLPFLCINNSRRELENFIQNFNNTRNKFKINFKKHFLLTWIEFELEDNIIEIDI